MLLSQAPRSRHTLAAGEQLLRQRFLLRTRQQYEEVTGHPAPAGKQYFQHSALADIISAYPFRSGLSGAAHGGVAGGGRICLKACRGL